MRDYTEIEDYYCPDCEWSLHIEKTVWTQFDNHQDILDYIQDKIVAHAQTHGVERKSYLYNPSTIQYTDNPYITYTEDTEDSSLIILKNKHY
jgi:hypothetical protein